MKRGATGWFERSTTSGEAVQAFVPAPLPPAPPLEIDAALQRAHERAVLSIGRLDALAAVLPDPDLFLYSYVRREAVLSSQIEGTHSSLSDLLLFELDEAPGVPLDDVVEVSSYVAALEHGIQRLRDGFPLSGRLFREVHGVLLAKGRGSGKDPGEFRRSQNWIGGTRPGNAVFVPPPAHQVPACISDLERFLHDENAGTVLVRAALAHAQFETIHPFLDGNGRVGRLLIVLLMADAGMLRQPLLYLSLYLKQNRTAYFEHLNRIRQEGDWESWLAFFLEGVHRTAEGAVSTARELQSLFKTDADRIQERGRSAGSALRVHEVLKRRPLRSIATIAAASSLSFPAVSDALAILVELGIVRELTGKKRNRVFAYSQYLSTLMADVPAS